MEHLKQLLKKTEFIEKYGIGNAHLLWALGLYLDESDFDKLASDGLTDGGNDKKIDFHYCNKFNSIYCARLLLHPR